MFFKKGIFAYAVATLSFSLSTPSLAYQERSSTEGWSDFDQEIQREINRSANSRPPKVISKSQPTHYEPRIVSKAKRVATKKVLVKEPITSRVPLVLSFSVGPIIEHAGETQTLQLAPYIRKTYNAFEETNTLAAGELFIGCQGTLNSKMQGQLGIAVAATNDAGLSGEVWDDADPEFNNYTYSYQVRHAHIALKGKLLLDPPIYSLRPYVSASAGVGFNYAQNFNNVPVIYEAVVMPNFDSRMTTTFTYTVGIGLQRTLSEHWQAGLGYEFASWGRSQLGTALGQSIGEGGLTLGQLNTNGILFNLTFVA